MKTSSLVIVGGLLLAAAAVTVPMALKTSPAQAEQAAPPAKAAPPLNPEQTELPPGHPPIPNQPPQMAANHPPQGGAEDGLKLHGKVLEVLDVPTYTYFRMSTATDGEIWAAVPKTDVKVGQEVDLVGASRMDGFQSPSLGRTFDKIVFANLAGR